LVALVLVAEPGAATDVATVPEARTAILTSFDLERSTELHFLVTTDGALVDLALVAEDEWSNSGSGTRSFEAARTWLNTAKIDELIWAPAGRWVVVVDNSDAPTGGANAQRDVALSHEFKLPDRSFWSAITFQTKYMRLADVGYAGLTIWMLIACVFAVETVGREWKLALGGTSAVAVIAMVSAVPVVGVGLLINYILPVLAGTGIGVVAYLRTREEKLLGSGALSHAYFATFMGIFVVDLAYMNMGVFGNEYPIIGGAGFSDVLFVAPVLSMVLVPIIVMIFQSHLSRIKAGLEAKGGAGPIGSQGAERSQEAVPGSASTDASPKL
jgi:hypothetical protein